MPNDSQHSEAFPKESSGLWLRARLSPPSGLVIDSSAPGLGRLFERTDGELAGMDLAGLLVGIRPDVVLSRSNVIARGGGESFYPQCRIPGERGVGTFSLECRQIETDVVQLTFAARVQGLPWMGDHDLLNLMLKKFPWPMQIFDGAGRLLGINPVFEQATGLTLDDLSDYNLLYDPTYRRENLANLVERLFKGELIRFDTLAEDVSHDPIWPFPEAYHHIHPDLGFPIFNDAGEVSAVLMSYSPVETGSMRADYVSESRQFAAQIIETADALIVCLDGEGRITLFNPKCEKTTGWKKEEVLGSVIWEILIPPRYLGKIRAVFGELTDGGVSHARMQNPWLTKDGRERLISWHNAFHRAPSGKIDRVMAIGIDITEQIHIEQKLRESEENYRSVTENSLTGIFIYQDDRFVYCNARITEILGRPREEILGRPVWEFVHPDERDLIRDRARRRQRGEPDLPSHYEFRVLHSDGETRWLEMVVSTMEFQRRPSFLGNVVDVTERKQIEVERDKLLRRLAQTQKMEALATLIGGIAHDFNNLLTGIMAGTSDVLSQTEPDDMRFRPLGDILQASRRAKDLISQLLTAGSQGPGAMSRVDVNEVIREVARYVKPTLDHKIVLRLTLAPESAFIVGDRSQLWQAVSNLCLNARDALPDGGIMEVKSEILPGDGPRQGSVVIAVSDTGKGIPAEIKDRIFEPFFTTKQRGLGIGLGLAVVYGAVKNHGGQIEIRDNPGGGTIFRIRLDLSPTDNGLVTGETAGEAPHKRHHTILIVDDEDGVRQVVGRILGREGHTVQTAKDAAEAMEKIGQLKDNLDLVILDLEIPGKGGAEIFADIKLARPDLKILLSSGQAPGSEAKRLLADGAAGFLQKPYDLWELRRAVEDAVVSSSQ